MVWLSRLFRAESPRATSVRRPPSRPAPLPAAKEPAGSPSLAATIESELDAALDDVFSDRKAPGSHLVVGGPSDEEEARRLFVDIAAQHARPVKDFVFELREGSASRRWIEICRPVLASIVDAAESMELDDLLEPLRELDGALSSAGNVRGATLSQTSRERIIAIYEKLAAVEPEAFAIDQADRRRESIFLHSLLGQIPDVGYVTIEKLYRVGLTSVEALSLATGAEVHVTADVPLDLSERICTWLAEHRESQQGLDPGELARQQRQRVVQLVAELRGHHEAFKKACDAANVDRSLAPAKREHRRLREACALQIEVALAELNELDLAREVQKLAFAQRIPRLEQVAQGWNEPDTARAGTRTALASKPTVTEG